MSTSEKGIVMNVYDVIKSLCDERGLAVTALEKEINAHFAELTAHETAHA